MQTAGNLEQFCFSIDFCAPFRVFLRNGWETNRIAVCTFHKTLYSGSTIAVPRTRRYQVAFFSRKCHLARCWKGYVNCGTALKGPEENAVRKASAPAAIAGRDIFSESIGRSGSSPGRAGGTHASPSSVRAFWTVARMAGPMTISTKARPIRKSNIWNAPSENADLRTPSDHRIIPHFKSKRKDFGNEPRGDLFNVPYHIADPCRKLWKRSTQPVQGRLLRSREFRISGPHAGCGRRVPGIGSAHQVVASRGPCLCRRWPR